MADAACFDPDPDLARRRLDDSPFDKFEFFGLADLNGPIGVTRGTLR
jgi:hypothetical protein